MKLPISPSPLLPRKSRYHFVFLAIFVFFVVLYSQNFSYTTFSDYYFVSVVSPAAVSGERSRSPPAKSAVSRAAESTDRRSPPPASAGGDGAEKKIEEKKKKEKAKKLLPFAVGSAPKGCDIYSGRWMRDESTRPLYKESECPYIHPQLTCQEHGRPDRNYQQWRWQPHACSLPA